MTRYLSLAEYLWLAEQVTGTEAAVLAKASRVDLADSALHAPATGFGEQDFYPDLLDKAAVLACHLAWNHPLPDGNKRAAWAALVLFLDLSGDMGARPTRCGRRRSGDARRRRAPSRRRLVRRLAPCSCPRRQRRVTGGRVTPARGSDDSRARLR